MTKLEIPAVLKSNWWSWTRELRRDPTNKTKKYRYRDPEIKQQLIDESASKCVYCESKLGDTLPGDTEHMIPTSVKIVGSFFWRNLTLACSDCNSKKRAYYDADTMFLNPYVDDVESMVIHQGPVVFWRPGDIRAEVTVKRLELHNKNRKELIFRKIEHLEYINTLVDMYMSTPNNMKKELTRAQLINSCDKSEKYSGMVLSVVSSISGIL